MAGRPAHESGPAVLTWRRLPAGRCRADAEMPSSGMYPPEAGLQCSGAVKRAHRSDVEIA